MTTRKIQDPRLELVTTDQPNRFDAGLARLEATIARAVHVAATLRVARVRDPEEMAPRFGGLIRSLTEVPGRVTVRPGQLATSVPAPSEARSWLGGLSRFYTAIAKSSLDKMPDKQLLLAQLERNVDRLTMAISHATQGPLAAISDGTGRTGRAHLAEDALERIEHDLLEEVDGAMLGAIPGMLICGPTGPFSQMVEDRLDGGASDSMLTRAADALTASPGVGPLGSTPPEPAADVAAAPGTRAPGAPTPPGTPAELGPPDLVTPLEFTDAGDSPGRGAIIRFDPTRFAPADDGPFDITVEVLSDPPRRPGELVGPPPEVADLDAEQIEDITSVEPAPEDPAPPEAPEPPAPPVPPVRGPATRTFDL